MLLETKQLTKRFRNPGKGPGGVLAVSQANMTLNPGETVGLFGDSGSGKSTLGLMLAGLLRPTSGEILYRGEPVRMPYRGACRRNVQVLFQHPEVSFNPMLPLIRSMEEPYRVHKLPYSPEILHRDIARFGLRPEHMQRLPAELSGGELQRAALARVLVLSPGDTGAGRAHQYAGCDYPSSDGPLATGISGGPRYCLCFYYSQSNPVRQPL